jgi:predicted DCC family thiol-disulfide oxidoreductase YuxK
MTRLTVLYDATCGFCVACRRWLEGQPKLLELEYLPAGSAESRRRFPSVSEAQEELVVISDEGGVYRGADAWIMCLYALAEYREWSLRLAGPALRPLARSAFEWLSHSRRGLSRRLRLAPDEEVLGVLRPRQPRVCAAPGPASGRASDACPE